METRLLYNVVTLTSRQNKQYPLDFEQSGEHLAAVLMITQEAFT